MKRTLIFFLIILSGIACAQTTPAPAVVMVSSNGLPPFAPLTTASGLFSISYTPTLQFVPMCSATGLPPFSQCDFSSGGGDTITSPNGTISIGGTPTATTIDAVSLEGGSVGQIPYQSAANTTTFLAGNTAATDKVVVSHGNGSAAQAPTLTNAPALSAANMTSIPSTTINGTTCTPGGSCTVAAGLFGPIIGVPTLSGTGLTTALNHSGTYSATNAATGILIADPTNTSGENVEGIMTAYPGVAFTATALISLQAQAANFAQASICVANTLTTQLMNFGMRWTNTPASGYSDGFQYNVNAYSTPTTFNSFPAIPSPNPTIAQYTWLRYKDNGTNLTFSVSLDGTFWQQIYTVAKSSSYLGASGFNYLGVCIDTDDYAVGTTLMSWSLTTP
jgi:hypothetical protein